MNQVTTILTVTDRFSYLESQLQALENQTVDSDIFIHWNTDKEYTYNYPALIYTNQHKRAPLYNRFFNSLQFLTPYVFICDDDILPGKKYLERCINFVESNNACIVSYGMIFAEEETQYKVKERIEHRNYLSTPKRVNMGGQGYFFKTDLLYDYVKYKTFDMSTGEDIHLGFICHKLNLPTYVLNSDKSNKDTWQDLTEGQRGIDNVAQWKDLNHKSSRDRLIKIYKELGWKFQIKSKI